ESISTIITERQQQLVAVSCEISNLETVMDDIKNLRQQLVERKENIIQSMTFHKGLRSALWRLPAEVLSQIFHYYLPEDKYLSPESKLAPTLLTRICRPWRDVAVDMPSLWCRLHVKFNQAVFHYDSWLKRSRGRPLSIALERYDSTALLGDLLQPYMDQISFLSIHFSCKVGKPQLFIKDMPALRELVIRRMDERDILTIAECISQPPSTMHVLDIMYAPFDINLLSSLDPVWAHLTQVKISFCRQDAFLHLLRSCPNLFSLTV
ncbi:uncharacterized protein F5891DRAFT_921844, partial [Suillus fuscotomentosus]